MNSIAAYCIAHLFEGFIGKSLSTHLGPRIFSTGDIFFVSERVCCGQVRSLEDARSMVRRQKALGATWIKEHTDPKRERLVILSKENRRSAREVARHSIVLLRNQKKLLPLGDRVRSIAVIGPLADSRKDCLGSWPGMGKPAAISAQWMR